jgi:putative membrane protein
MKLKYLLTVIGLLTALCSFGLSSFAADDTGMKPTAKEKMFVKKAAMGGMTEVALGKVAAANGGSDEVKDFGNQMVKDHTTINDNLKEVAGKMGLEVPAELDAPHQGMVDRMNKMSGPAFDKAYVKAMVKDHQMDVAEFEKAEGMVKNEDLKKFISDSVPTMKEHLDKIQKFNQANGMAKGE